MCIKLCERVYRVDCGSVTFSNELNGFVCRCVIEVLPRTFYPFLNPLVQCGHWSAYSAGWLHVYGVNCPDGASLYVRVFHVANLPIYRLRRLLLFIVVQTDRDVSVFCCVPRTCDLPPLCMQPPGVSYMSELSPAPL